MGEQRTASGRDPAQLRNELTLRFATPPELAFEAVVDGRDAIVAVEGPARRLQVISAGGDDQVIDLRSGGTIQRRHRGSSIEVRLESGGHQISLFDLTDWATAGLLIESLRLRGFRSESPAAEPAGRGRTPRVLPTQRRGVMMAPAPPTRATA